MKNSVLFLNFLQPARVSALHLHHDDLQVKINAKFMFISQEGLVISDDLEYEHIIISNAAFQQYDGNSQILNIIIVLVKAAVAVTWAQLILNYAVSASG